VDEGVQAYIEAIPPEHRPLFDRLHELVLGVHPDAKLVLSYKMPTYKVGKNRLHVGAWKHGISLYGWKGDRDGGFSARHPELLHAKSTIQIRPSDASAISDDELRDLIRAALG
jgi:uncharacterized protein YdhG (YjbR/CyaY superfamily)